MRRREFLKVGGAGVGMISGRRNPKTPGALSYADGIEGSASFAPAVLYGYSVADHRQRLQNIALCEHGIRKCLRQHLITNYLPGQCTYNLGEYPCRKPWDPDDWDERELDSLKEHGISLVQVHEEWNDAERLYGADKFSPLNPLGFRRFVEMVHKRGMKLIVYVSSGYFERRDPDFRPEWARTPDLVELWYDYAHNSPASPGWRAYFLPKVAGILDNYGVDGIYNDLGYESLAAHGVKPSGDEIDPFAATDQPDGALIDLLGLIYSEVKRRGGIVKIHYGGARAPQANLKIYDYLWVGEAVQNADFLREAVKNHPPYVVPCVDMSRAHIDNEDELYLESIPYMQFPLLLAGRPFTGERAMIPGIEYRPEEKDFWTRHFRAIWKYYQTHPQGPYSYGSWDSVPGRPSARSTHARWLKQYLPLVEDGTWAWLEINDSNFFRQPLPQNIVASAFANRALYLVLANYGNSPAEIEMADAYTIAEDPSAGNTRWSLGARSLNIIKRLA